MPPNKDKIEARRKEVLEVKLADPTKNIRTIAKEIGSSKTTVANDLIKLGHDGTIQANETINAIKDADLEIVTLGQSILLDRMKDKDERKSISARDVSAVSKDAQVRYSFLNGANSDDDGGEVKAAHIEKAMDAISKYLNE